jgi:hypothetical protein
MTKEIASVIQWTKENKEVQWRPEPSIYNRHLLGTSRALAVMNPVWD